MVQTRAQSKGSAPKEETKAKKKMVPRKKLPSVGDLLVNGDEESTEMESLALKLGWMFFLCVLFYVSFEVFLRLRAESQEGSQSEL